MTIRLADKADLLRAARQYERGVAQAGKGDVAGAIATLREAVQINPGLSAAWYRLGALLIRAGDAAAADAALTAYADTAGGDDDDVKQCVRALAERRLDLAERICRSRLKNAPMDVVALRLLAQVCMLRQQGGEAEGLLYQAVELAPGFAAARRDLVRLLLALKRPRKALPHVDIMLANEPGNVEWRTALARCRAMTSDFAGAIDILEDLVKEAPQDTGLWAMYGHALKMVGRRIDSARAYRTCVGIAPELFNAWRALITVNTEALTPAEIAGMRALLDTPDIPLEDSVGFNHALGRAYEQAGDYANSFAHYAQAAREWRTTFTYDADRTTAQTKRVASVFTPALLSEKAGWGFPDPAPIFVLGMPRSGSTLVEQILASHSLVEPTAELQTINRIVDYLGERGLRGEGEFYPQCFTSFGADELATLGERYIEATREFRKTDKPYFVDKMPMNWEHIGMISLILPRAKIIDVRRHPVASCFSSFKHWFPDGMHYSFDLVEVARYYNDYLDMMAHCDEALPGRIHRVIYEDMVENTDSEIRRLLDYCELPFEAACLRFWETDRQVRTASFEQVRRPIYREGLDNWRHYEAWLGPIEETLARRRQ